MIKVEHTKTHKITFLLSEGQDTFNTLVTDAELVFVNPNQDVINTLTSHGKLATAFKEHSIETGKNSIGVDLWWKRSETKLLGIPILISRTEKIEKGDWVYDTLTKNLFQVHNTYTDTCVKGIALPEHFSPQQLQDIIDGKLKEGKMLVECEIYQDTINYHKDIWANFNRIKLNPHITIYPVEEKMYTREDVKHYLNLYWHHLQYSDNKLLSKEWFEQHVK